MQEISVEYEPIEGGGFWDDSMLNAATSATNLLRWDATDLGNVTSVRSTWYNCLKLKSFSSINLTNATDAQDAWQQCTSLTSFPANVFDSWSATPANNCFLNAWLGCSSLTATSVKNILDSIDTSQQSAPASGTEITIDYNTLSGTLNVSTAISNLKSRSWTIKINGSPQ